jgi:single-stranded-DNA-specific exonuclease
LLACALGGHQAILPGHQRVAGLLALRDQFDGLLTDGELLPDELNIELAELIRASGPWGQAFPEPLFDGEFVLVQQRLVGEKHLKMMLTTDSGHAVDAIAFGVDLQRWPDASVKRVRLVYRLDVNEWRGNRSVQLLVEHLEAAGL